MKTLKQNRKSIAVKTVQRMVTATLFLIMLVSCSNDDGVDSSIKAQKTIVTIEGINNCSTSIGDGTILSLVTPYSAPESLKIVKIRIKATVSNGQSEESTTTNFTDTGSTVEWGGCFTFGSQEWVEYEVRLEASDGTLSNQVTTRVNKPNGAN